MTDYYKSSAEETLRELQTSPTGLTSRQAQARQEKYGINKLKEAEKPGFLKRFFLQLKDPMLLILLAAAAVSALTGMLSGESEWAETIIILVVVLLIFGPKNLPKLGKMFGKTINGFKKGMEDEDAEQSEETVKKADKKDEDEE